MFAVVILGLRRAMSHFCIVAKVVRGPILWVPVISAPRTRGTGGTQSLQAPRYPGDWRDSVLSDPQVPWGLAGLSPFSSPGTLEDWWDSSPFRPPDTLKTGDTQSY